MSEEIKTELNEDETVCPFYDRIPILKTNPLIKPTLKPRLKPMPTQTKSYRFFRRMTSKSLVHLTIQGKKMIQTA